MDYGAAYVTSRELDVTADVVAQMDSYAETVLVNKSARERRESYRIAS